MLVLTRDAAISVLRRVTVASISRRIRDIPTEVILDEDDGMPARCAVSLDNLGVVPKALLVESESALDNDRMRQAATRSPSRWGVEHAGRVRSLYRGSTYTCYCMCMATMTRRLQLLLDEERMTRLEERAAASGQSVASLIREAIDVAYPPTDAVRRREAAQRLLSAASMPVDADWAAMKAADRAALYRDDR